MSLLATLIAQITPPQRRTGADRQREYMARKIETQGVETVRRQAREQYYRNRDAILARRKLKRDRP